MYPHNRSHLSQLEWARREEVCLFHDGLMHASRSSSHRHSLGARIFVYLYLFWFGLSARGTAARDYRVAGTHLGARVVPREDRELPTAIQGRRGTRATADESFWRASELLPNTTVRVQSYTVSLSLSYSEARHFVSVLGLRRLSRTNCLCLISDTVQAKSLSESIEWWVNRASRGARAALPFALGSPSWEPARFHIDVLTSFERNNKTQRIDRLRDNDHKYYII